MIATTRVKLIAN